MTGNAPALVDLLQELVVDVLVGHTGSFKLGVASEPRSRFSFYSREGFSRMVVLHRATDCTQTASLERALIARFSRLSLPGVTLLNRAPGGESVSSSCIYTYVVLKPLRSNIWI